MPCPGCAGRVVPPVGSTVRGDPPATSAGRDTGAQVAAVLCRTTATWRTTHWPRLVSWRCECASRFFWRGSRASARPRWHERWPAAMGGELIRLQCHEGIDCGQAVYEWDYSRQILHLRGGRGRGARSPRTRGRERGGQNPPPDLEDSLFTERYLIARPLLRAIHNDAAVAPVLLVDEVDRADDEFEAFLLEALSEYAVTVPELATFSATVPPVVVLTSNRTRDVHDALKRRCLYHWVEHPDLEREVQDRHLPGPGGVGRGGPRRSPRSPSDSVSWACTSRRAWPRPSTGRWPCPRWASGRVTVDVVRSTWVRYSSTARTRNWSWNSLSRRWSTRPLPGSDGP